MVNRLKQTWGWLGKCVQRFLISRSSNYSRYSLSISFSVRASQYIPIFGRLCQNIPYSGQNERNIPNISLESRNESRVIWQWKAFEAKDSGATQPKFGCIFVPAKYAGQLFLLKIVNKLYHDSLKSTVETVWNSVQHQLDLLKEKYENQIEKVGRKREKSWREKFF